MTTPHHNRDGDVEQPPAEANVIPKRSSPYPSEDNGTNVMEVDDTVVSLEGDGINRFIDGDAASVPVPKKKKKPTQQSSASLAASTASALTAGIVATTTATIPPSVPEAAPAPATAPRKIYFRANEDNNSYAISYVSIDNNVVTLKHLKNLLVEANEWPETSRVVFSSGDERLAFTTLLSDCLLDNASENPLLVNVQTMTAISKVPLVARQDGKSTGKSICLFLYISIRNIITCILLRYNI